MSTLPVGDWAVDGLHSDVAFQVAHYELQEYRASFNEYSAQLHTDDGGIGIEGSVVVDSVDIAEGRLRDTVLGEEFLDAANHPKITFRSSSIDVAADGSLKLAGTLTLKGTSGEVTATGKLTGPVVDMQGNQRVAVLAEAVIDRTQYGLAWAAELDGGETVVSNDVKLIAHLELSQG